MSSEEDFETVYQQIVEKVLALGNRPEGVIYAVPGDPFIAEAACLEIAKQAGNQNLDLRVIHGISFLEGVCEALRVDAFPQLTLVDAFELVLREVPSFPTSSPAVIGQVFSRSMASEVKLTLMAQYPDEHPVQYVHAGGTKDVQVEGLRLFEIDRSEGIGTRTSLYIPPIPGSTSLEGLQDIVARLRAPEGCPWDKEQTRQTLRPSLMEEAFEVLDAIDRDHSSDLQEELGDLLFQIFILAQIAAEDGEFGLGDVVDGISTKLIRRHPHVFGDGTARDVKEVLETWERLKAEERREKGVIRASILEGVGQNLPALAQAARLQQSASTTGFEWPDISGVFEKILEELEELQAARTEAEKSHELGDLLFTISHLANWFEINPENALREANLRFRARFHYIEMAAKQNKKNLVDMPLEEMEAYWNESKTQLE